MTRQHHEDTLHRASQSHGAKNPSDEATLQWLQDAPAASAHALEMLNMPNPPNPIPPSQLSGFYKPNSVEDFVAAQQACLDAGCMLMLDPSTRLEFDREVTFTARGTRQPTGLWAYGAQFAWKSDGDWTRHMITYTTNGQENQFLTIAGLSIQADQTNGSQAAPERVLSVVARSGAAIAGMHIDDLTIEGGKNGLWLEGEVFESYIQSPRMRWVRDAGIRCRHQYDVPGVLSNIFINQPDITRVPINMGSAVGILCDRAPSVLIDGGNFISLDGPAIRADAGVKRVTNCSLENCGNVNGVGIEIWRSDFFSQVLACEGSNTNGDMKYLCYYGGDPNRFEIDHSQGYDCEELAPSSFKLKPPQHARETAEGLVAKHEAIFNRHLKERQRTPTPTRRK